ncbi:hypothetical protein AAVH_37258, partial [Aphelenchoides avenae]
MSNDDDQVLEAEYEVERIVGHDVVWVLKEVGTMSKKRKLAHNQVVYRVRWVGYGPEDDTWEPAEHFDGTDFLEDYCPQHGLYGQDRLTCEGRMHKVSADGPKPLYKKKSITRDPPPKKAKIKRVSVDDSDDDLTHSNRPSTSGEGVKKHKEKKHRANREKSSTPSNKASATKKALIESDSDDDQSRRDSTHEHPSTSKLGRENSVDSLHTSETSSVVKPKSTDPEAAAKHAGDSSVKKSSSSGTHKAHHGSERKKSVDEAHGSKKAKKRKHEDDGQDPERKKKPKLHDAKEVQSAHSAKSVDSSKLTQTSKITLKEKNPHTSGDAFMAAFQPKTKDIVHRPKPSTVPTYTPSITQPKHELKPIKLHS